ncbi:DmsC/YnfH family molybdoenzyme membrane anchor subunit [Aeromonas enteropelogenes]|uniref:DmsC/YnfH family molybdoenzyme membrane anchor subunit n=1 Tax=Aeromonas enteropelogenes TaxID=29489 RepID=UPI0005AB012B|nr:DmsC/YnfH family molybdoenzyme membrane anchor subunit [Aeromonas enteropelogenes]UBH51984.1 dimethyl sulfoxide reductase anchor subunit [Aeromonas enteropelogenes]
MAWHEWPLILFTVMAQTAVGAFLILSALLLARRISAETEPRLHRAMLGLWVLMGLGLVASVMHLGSPLRAMNALNMVGHSWLSNEIAGGMAFFAFGGLYWLLSVLDKGSEGGRRGLMLGAILAGLFFMYAMIMVYMIDTVPTWYTGLTPASFLLTMGVGGGALAHLLLLAARHDVAVADTALPVWGLLVALGVAIAVMLLSLHLGGIENSVTSALARVPDLAVTQSVRLVLLAAGVLLWLWPLFTKRTPTAALMAVSFGFILVSELVGRGVFYGIHLTAGLG